MSGTGTFFYEEPHPVPSLSAAKENKATTALRKKKEDDIVSDNRFKLHNGREVFEEKAYLVGVERRNDVQDFGIKESLSELSQLADTACQSEGLTKPCSFSLASVEKGKLKDALIGIKDLFIRYPAEQKLHKYAVVEKVHERLLLESANGWRSLYVVNNSLEMAQLAMEDILSLLKKEMATSWRTYLGSNCIFVVCNI
ncbi:hypothetical protein JHK87_055786 [Glycine soja]|nr:hypothetical protein JHK87_055786 [Glycine soja]